MKKLFLIAQTSALLFLAATQAMGQQASDMLDKTISAVVTIAVYEDDQLANQQLGFRGRDDNSSVSAVAYEHALDLAGARSSGSGFVISYKGTPYIVTNAHVVERAAKKPGSIALFSIDRSKYEVKLIGGDSFYDIAVLAFVDPPGDEINTVAFREADARLGERVYAIGNPLGEYPYSVSDGIISAKNRVRGGLTGKFGFLQTTATVIWGNSGGPLVDEHGDVVGINSQIAFTESAGQSVWLSQINFALESGLSKRLVENILEHNGRVERAYFGMEFSQDQAYNAQTGFATDGPIILSSMIDDAPSKNELAPLVGSQLLQINDTPIRTVEEALYELEHVRPGETLTLHLNNNGRTTSQVVKSTALQARQLESIAAHFIQGIPDVELKSASPQLSIKLKQNKMQSYGKDKFQELKNPSNYLEQTYVILAAGIKGQDYERMWRTHELYDMGAALKLSGLSGVIDLYVADAADSKENIQIFRRNFSNSEDVATKKLWY